VITLTENTKVLTKEMLAKFLAENEAELLTLSKEDRDLSIFQEGYIAGLERAISVLTAPAPKPF
jgi:hypothetical protein